MSNGQDQHVAKPRIGRFTSYVFHTAGSSAMATLASAAISIIAARSLGPSGRGAMSLLILLPILVLTLGRMGVGHAINYYASKWSREQLVSSVLALALVVGAGFTIVSVPAILLLKNVFFRGIETSLILLACTVIPTSFLLDYLPSLFQGYYDVKSRNLMLLAVPIGNLVLLIVFVVVLRLELFGAVLAYVASNLIVASWSVAFVHRVLGVRRVRPVWWQITALVRYGAQSHLGLIFKELNYRGNVFLVSYFLNPAAVGLYVAAVNVAEMLWKLPEATGTVLLPRVSHMEQKEGASFAAAVLRALLLPMIVSTVIVLVFGKYIVLMMFGAEFLPSVTVLRWLMPGMFAMAFWKIVANSLIGLGRAIKYSITSGVALAVMVLLDIALIPILGLEGAAIACSVSYLIATAYIYYLFVDLTGLPLRDLWLPRRADFEIYQRLLTNVFVTAKATR